MQDELLTRLSRLGVRLRLVDGQLRVLAPKGALTGELRDAITARREQLVALLGAANETSAQVDLPSITPDPDERHEPFPLSDVQHSYWIGRNPYLELGGVATHFYFELTGRGLRPDRLQESLNRVIQRHDMLRAVIGPDGRQRVLPDVPGYRIELRDVSNLTGDEQQRAITDVRARMQAQVIPADRWPLFDVRATLLGGDRTVLHISLDLLVVDGRSINLLFADWQRYYTDPSWSPSPLELSFRDYLLAERAIADGPIGQRAERYWLDRIDALPPGPELPLAVAPAKVGPPRFTRRRARLAAPRWQAIARLAGDHDLTPSALLMAAFAEVLRTWAKRPDFTLNLTLFSRVPLHPQVDQVIGDFTSLILLAVPGTSGAASDTFLARATRLRRQLLADLEHLAFSGVRAMRERQHRIGSGPGAALPVVFTSALGLPGHDDGTSARDFFGEFSYGISQTPQVWLDHQVFTEHGDLVWNWDAVDELFPPGVLDEMFHAYGDLLDRMVDRGTELLASTGRLVGVPAGQLAERDAANATGQDLPAETLHGLVAGQVRRRPDAVAVIAGDFALTYRELWQQAERLAGQLRALGAGPGSLVAVSMDKGAEQVVAVLGVLSAGAAYLPVDPDWPAERRAFLLAQAGARLVVTQPGLDGRVDWPAHVQTLQVRAEHTAPDEHQEQPPAAAPDRTTPDDLAYVIFTSGSTGQPKGVAIDHRGACNTVQDINQRFGVGQDDRVLALSALSFDLSVYDIFGLLAAGGAIVLPVPALARDPAHWSELIGRHRVTVWNSVPALMRLWEEAHQGDGPAPGASLRLALLSGDWIPVWLPDRVRARYPRLRLVSLGGATEASIWSVYHPIGEVSPDWPSIPYGKPLANQTLHVYDQWLDPCPVWTAGELYIGGAGLARGYWGDPERTAQRFVTHPRTGQRLYRTGDLGRYLPGGDIEFLGRADHQVKINGYRIELGEIAATLRRQPGVRDALATVATTVHDRPQLVGYVVTEPGEAGQVDPAVLRASLEKWLPEYMIPHRIVPLDRLPLTRNGKVDLAALPPPWPDAEPAIRVAPRTEPQRRLAAIWRDVLGHDEFGVEDNFFELGGDSLHAVHIIRRMRAEFGLDIEQQQGFLQDLLLNPTIAALATAVAGPPAPPGGPA